MKILITGTYCSGKSTISKKICENIENSVLIEEAARELILGLPTIDWSKDYIRKYLLVRQVLLEESLNLKNKIVVIDAGVESNIAHENLLSNSNEGISTLLELGHTKYDLVFFCNHTEIPFINDGQRIDDEELRGKLAKQMRIILNELNYNPIDIKGSEENRLNQILERLNKLYYSKC